MKPIPALLFLSALPAAAQAPAAAKSSAHPSVHHSTASGGCAKLPELSSKIPALPAGLPCPKPLYTVTTQPPIKLDYLSPLEGEDLKETLGIETSTFSLDYVDTKAGTGEAASPHKWYSINYTGYLVDGTKFDSSYDRNEPISIPIGQHRVIPGWDTGFGGMRVGGKRRLFIPYQLGYGTNPHQAIPGKSMLIFDLELVAVSETQPKPKTPPTPARPPATPNAAKPLVTVPPGGSSATPASPSGSQGMPGTPTKPAMVPPASTTPPPTTPKP